MMRGLQSRRSMNSGWLVIKEFCDWLSTTTVSVAFQSANWFVPTVQTVHIISIAILLTSVYVVSFRLIGVTRRGQPLAVLVAKSTPWVWITLCVLLGTGILLTITEPARELLNWAFRVKMLMVIALAGILAACAESHTPQPAVLDRVEVAAACRTRHRNRRGDHRRRHRDRRALDRLCLIKTR